jgi:hypothetical protein
MRFVAINEPAARFRLSFDRRFTPRFTAGVEYHPEIREVLPRATWFITPPRGDLPSVVLGFNADRLSTPEGHAIFLTFAKRIPGTPFTPFASVKYGTPDRMFAYPFGVNYQATQSLSFQLLYDGNYTHALGTMHLGDAAVTLMLARMKHPGVALTLGF